MTSYLAHVTVKLFTELACAYLDLLMSCVRDTCRPCAGGFMHYLQTVIRK